jgi:ribosomal protein S18 acetylase RimI-like enzyme
MVYRTAELKPQTYDDFASLAVKQGGCWCMYYQRAKPAGRGLSAQEWKRINRREKEKFVKEGWAHAALVYDGPTPVGWCQYGPKEELPRIDAGRFYRKAAPPPGPDRLWRITCFFVDRKYRRRGVARAALSAALASIKRQGGGMVEAYPVVSIKMAAAPEWLWFGTPDMFRAEGFTNVAPLGTSRVLMRKRISA